MEFSEKWVRRWLPKTSYLWKISLEFSLAKNPSQWPHFNSFVHFNRLFFKNCMEIINQIWIFFGVFSEMFLSSVFVQKMFDKSFVLSCCKSTIKTVFFEWKKVFLPYQFLFCIYFCEILNAMWAILFVDSILMFFIFLTVKKNKMN